MINYKTKAEGTPYNYGDKTYYIKHGLFRVNDYKVSDDLVSVYISMTGITGSYVVSPYYDKNIGLIEGMIIKVAYIEMEDGNIRVHGYEAFTDQGEIDKFMNAISNTPAKKVSTPGQQVDIQLMLERIDFYISLVTDRPLNKLLKYVYNTYYDKIKDWPAAVSVHHNIKHGLLLHLANVTKQALDIAKNYSNVDLDLVIAGALLHDIGKVIEYTEDGKISDVGKYQDHISIGQIIVTRINEAFKINNEEYVDDRTFNRLIHIIVSHHGKLEWGSPKVPCSKEAFIVHQADYIDTNMYIMHESYKKVSCGQSDYNKMLGAYIVNEYIDAEENYNSD